MLRQFIVISSLVLFSAAVIGCAGSTHLSSNYGKSYNVSFAAQVINPDAPNDRAPVDGMPGYIATQIFNDTYIPSLTNAESDK